MACYGRQRRSAMYLLWLFLALVVQCSGRREAPFGDDRPKVLSHSEGLSSPQHHTAPVEENDGIRPNQQMTLTPSEYEILKPLINCCVALSPGANNMPCVVMFNATWHRLGLTIRGDAFVSSEGAFMFFQLLRCTSEHRAAGRERCVNGVLSSQRELGVAVDALVYRRGSPRGPAPTTASHGGRARSPEFQLSGIVIPVGEQLTSSGGQFYQPLVECASQVGQDDSGQRCALAYLRRWERMGVSVPRGRLLTERERSLLVHLLSCEGLPVASAEQTACLRMHFDAAEEAGVQTLSLLDAGLQRRLNSLRRDGTTSEDRSRI